MANQVWLVSADHHLQQGPPMTRADAAPRRPPEAPADEMASSVPATAPLRLEVLASVAACSTQRWSTLQMGQSAFPF
jgi:hypothetical protein